MTDAIKVDADGFGYIACEWTEQSNRTVTTSCGVRIRHPDEHSKCPRCLGRIVFLDYEDEDDDAEYYDDDHEGDAL
jgi:hypothetical protein